MTAADGASTTTYSYEGNTTKVTDAAGKWKRFTTNARGNLVKVTEPNPAGGEWETNYAYDGRDLLVQVSMTRDGATQVRSFEYNGYGWRLSKAVNPENGTVTYSYNAGGTLASRTDAKNQRVEYSYDGQQRVTQIRRYNAGQQNDDGFQRVDLYYDTNPFDAAFTQNGWGRPVAAVYKWYSPGLQVVTTITEMYSYTTGGRMTKKRMRWSRGSSQRDLEAVYTYDNEGKMVSVQYPGKGPAPNNSGPATFTYSYTFDNMGRPSTLTERWVNSEWNLTGTIASNAVYGVAGELRGLNYGFNETRDYNSMLQLTRLTVPSMVDLEYRYAGNQNNGRITQMKDWVSGEEVNYSYDALNRLATAVTTGPEWGNSYTYDGFGNLRGKTVIKESAPYLSLSIDPATNRLPGSDANGNAWGPTYDIENRMVSYGQEEYAYGVNNERVWRRYWDTGTYKEEVYFYGADGRKLATFAVIGTQILDQQKHTQLYFGGKLIRAAGKTVVVDRLGSVRANSGGERLDYYPYGEEKPGATVQGREKFGTYYRDTTGLDYAMNRYYHSAHGRFVTPDPYRASGGVEDPGSWNRYAYVQNDPVNFYDPGGLIRAELSNDGLFCPSIAILDTIGPEGQPVHSFLFGADILCRAGGPGRQPRKSLAERLEEQYGVSEDCARGLVASGARGDALQRARGAADVLKNAASQYGTDPGILAAIGVYESGFVDRNERDGHGNAVGIFQFATTSGVSASVASDLSLAAAAAANMLNANQRTILQAFPNLSGAMLQLAVVSSWNLGAGGVIANLRAGNSPQYHSSPIYQNGRPTGSYRGGGTGQYGTDVLRLADCFK